MSKELFVTSTPHETKLAIVEDDQLVEVYFERENEYTLAGSIYKGKTTRVLPGMQSAFVEIGLERDAFLYVSDFVEGLEEDQDDIEPAQQSQSQSQLQTAPSPQSEQPRGGGRNRQDRGRGRGGRPDRGSDRPLQTGDRGPYRGNRPPLEVATESAGPAAFEADYTDAESAEAETPIQAAEDETAAQSGEQSTDGPRRWRGRRGRRRRGGRTNAPETGVAAENENLQGASLEGDLSGNVQDEVEFSSDFTDEIESTGPEQNFHAAPEVSQQQAAQPAESLDRPNREHRGDRDRDRDRGSDRHRRERQPREHQPREQQSREHQSREHQDSGSDFHEGRTEPRIDSRGNLPPIILPGESLRKWNPNPEPEKPQAPKPGTTVPTSAFRPSTLVEPAGLAGAGLLAGETLRKYKDRPVREESVPHSREHRKPAYQDRQEEIPAPRREALDREEESRSSSEQEKMPHVREANVGSHQPRSEAAERPDPVSAEAAVNATFEEEKSSDHAQEPTPHAEQRTEPHGFDAGEGVFEEELVEEEEHHSNPDAVALHEEYDTFENEVLEEETMDHDREAEVIAAGEPLAAAFAESRRDSEESFIEELDADEVEDVEEAGESEEEDPEDAELFADADGDEDEELVDPEDPAYEGSAEVRAPAGTAGFQQRSEPRTERPGEDRKRGGRKGRITRGRPGMRRGGPHRAPRVLPQINEVLKEGQEILVQIAKEPMAKKGARITSHIALPGRFLVYMPTVGHTGVSRKIALEEERHRLKRILLSEKGQNHGGFIVRTAASGASEDDLRADIRFLINLWNEIKQRSESSKAPALIYHDLNLVERILRDQVTSTFSQIWVDSEQEYERILRFATRFQPSLVKRVKLYSKDIPLFEQFNIQEEINKGLKSKVWLKSGGYIVINQTEALVAIDINTGKFVGKTARLEDTIVKTNIDAIKEIVRQIRLRDLGGIIVIDFIDMEERRNRQKVMQELEQALQADRSPSKVLQFNDFGLVAITRKRVKQSLERTLGTQCTYCTGTGMIKSVATVCNEIFVEMRKMMRHFDHSDITLRVNPEVGKALKANTGKWLLEMEEMVKKPIIVKSDPLLHQEQFDIN